MSTGFSWEGIRQVHVTLLCARHVAERLCGGRVYLGCYNKCSTFTFNNLSLNEAIDVAQNRPLWRLTSTFGATHS